MLMSRRLRKAALTVHIASSVGLLGAIASFLALSVTTLSGDTGPLIRGGYLALEILALDVVVPLAWAALLSGLIMALGTRWGLLRHWWVLTKLVITTFALAVLTLKIPLIRECARIAAGARARHGVPMELGAQLVLHSVGGLVTLLLPLLLSVYKPTGVTPFGTGRVAHRNRTTD